MIGFLQLLRVQYTDSILCLLLGEVLTSPFVIEIEILVSESHFLRNSDFGIYLGLIQAGK